MLCIFMMLAASVEVVEGLAGVRFQTGAYATTDSLLHSGATLIPALAQVSVCLHLRPLHLTRTMPIISYKVEGSPKELYLGLEGTSRRLVFGCCGGSVEESVAVPIRLYEWQPICLALHLLARNITFAYSTTVEQVPLKVDVSKLGWRRLEVVGDGELVVGQSTDTVEGLFDLSQTLHGDVADLRLYDVALTLAQIKSFMGCFKDELLPQTPALVSLEQRSFVVRGPTEEMEVAAAEVCGGGKNSFAMLFPQKKNFNDALTWCEKLRGELALPASGPENQDIYNRFVRFSRSCQDMWQALYWVGARGDMEGGRWLSLREGQPLVWHNLTLASSSVTQQYQCILAGGTQFPYEWYHAPCSVSTCTVCNFTTYPEIHLRGLCHSSLFDRSLFLHDYFNQQPLFDGTVHSRVAWVNGSWKMESRLYPDLWARMLDQVDYPVGLHKWLVEGDKCRQKEVELLLTACRQNEFTCNDGSCIDAWRRCDFSTDCPDHSDELTCRVVKAPEGYNPSMPPPRLSSGPIPLYFHLNITSVSNFDVQKFMLGVDAIITLRWNESRVTFLNLQADQRRNKIKDQHTLWTPKLRVTDGTNSWVKESSSDGSDLYVQRFTSPEADDDSLHHEEDTYNGSENSLVYQMHRSIHFRCDLDLQWYPFDSQRCHLYFTIQDLTDSSGGLVKDEPGLEFSGRRQLLEYNLVNETLVEVTEDQVITMKLSLKFINLYKYYAMNAFLPSLMMVVISYSTLFFHLDDFENRIMVSLTSQLVLASFFSQGSLIIPKTSYLKLIDVWYVSLISQVFVIIVSLVFVEIFRLQGLRCSDGIKTVHVTPVDSIKVPHSSPESAPIYKANILNTFFIFLFPTIFFSFITYFAVTCVRGLKS